jgi:hypothetical protein
MTYRFAAASIVIAAALTGSALPVAAADLPAIKTSNANTVTSCATPGRLMAFLKARNDKLDPRFDTIATEYMRHGEDLKVRWDTAFFQMVVETGSLKFGGDVKPSQNNFAGLGATGNGERGEAFKDVATGVRAHLEHLVMYTGEKLANPVAERTRKVQEWGVLTDWQKTIKGPMTFTQLARKWAPPARKYAQEIESVAENFADGACRSPDPRPELVAAARSGSAEPPPAPATSTVAAQSPAATPAATTPGAELAKRANDEARAEGSGKRSALGAAAVAKAAQPAPPTAPATEPAAETGAKPADKSAVTKVAAGAAAKTGNLKPALKGGPCKVFTASYGGAKAIIIKAETGDSTNYTVLDVNEGSETREADAYIAAYAPGGKPVGEFKSSTAALDKAFDLCPEG